MFNDCSIKELREVLELYKSSEAESPVVLSAGEWTIAEGGYDKWWEIYYGQNCRPIAECVARKVSVYGFSATDNELIKNVILSVLDYLN